LIAVTWTDLVRLPHRTLGLSHRLNDALLVVLGALTLMLLPARSAPV
jgi:hypothetical protein